MTLLIGTYSRDNILLTADGLCVKHDSNGAETERLQDYQKIFPAPDPNLSLAVCHHGQNELFTPEGDMHPIKQALTEFFQEREEQLKTASLEDVCALLIEDFKDRVSHTLGQIGGGHVVGFWVCGLLSAHTRHKVYEICWPDDADPKPMEPLIFGGHGQFLVEKYLSEPCGKFRAENLKKMKLIAMQGYHKALYDEALRAKEREGREEFGGDRHQLGITKKGWFWRVRARGV